MTKAHPGFGNRVEIELDWAVVLGAQDRKMKKSCRYSTGQIRFRKGGDKSHISGRLVPVGYNLVVDGVCTEHFSTGGLLQLTVTKSLRNKQVCKTRAHSKILDIN